MAKVFGFNPSQGELKDKISGVVPVNTNVVIKNTEKGRAAYFYGTAKLAYGIANFRSSDTQGSIVGAFKTGTNSKVLFSSVGSSAEYLEIYITGANSLKIRQRNNDTNDEVYATLNIADNNWHFFTITSDGSQYTIYIDNVERALNIDSGTNSGDWFADTLNRTTLDVSTNFVGNIPLLKIYNHVLSVSEREHLYQEFLHAQTQLVDPLKQKALKEGSADSDVLFCDNGLDWNADGVTKSAGQFIGDWKVGSGTSRCKEDVTGKYIECVTNGTLIFNGIDLSDIVGNGYVKELTGDLSGFEGGTVAAAGIWTPNKLTLTMTAGQVIRNIAITRGV